MPALPKKIVKDGLPFVSAGFCGQSARPKRVSPLGKIENIRGGVLTYHEQTAFDRKPFFKVFQCPITGECYGGCSPENIGYGLLMLSEMNGRYKGGEGKGLWGAGARPPFITHLLRTRQVTSNRGRAGGGVAVNRQLWTLGAQTMSTGIQLLLNVVTATHPPVWHV